ncbi:DUF4396 domain-containing protein [Streptomyces sp. SID161]|uniref:DUF4396 domain-containing protein n=1 Tax=Streptomyces sp. SID161 TaxID=2690251 RepID=UPI00136ACB21|nr:DUF4396 domain-containing protein [Streptomyces sp. SID161]MYW42891.1 DUF4396 domain-containing protein [Streptomyces sp. SID161]
MEHEAHAHHTHHGHAAHEHHEAAVPADRQAHHHEAAAPTDHQAHHHEAAATWRMAAQATLHCLTGCAIGEVLGMVLGTAFGWGNLPTTVLAIALAFLFGYSLTLRGVLRAGVGFRTAFRVALAADTLSIAVMELIDNGVILVWPSARDAMLGDALFWISLTISLVTAFVVTTPVNKWTIGRGKGHAVVHRYHH